MYTAGVWSICRAADENDDNGFSGFLVHELLSLTSVVGMSSVLVVACVSLRLGTVAVDAFRDALLWTVHSLYSMCSLTVSTLDSPAADPRSNPGAGKLLMSENFRLYTTSPVVIC